MKDIKLIAFDLDGTMLNDKKELTEENRQVLLAAAEKGIHIVPATGRLPKALPTCFRDLPIRYGIFINGAEVTDLQTGDSLGQSLIPWEQAIEVYEYAEQFDIIYDCYMDNKAYMSRAFRTRIPEFALNAHYLKMMWELRTTVPELKTYLAQRKEGVQKLQFYFRKDQYDLREELLANWKIPGIEVSTSVPNNLELNNAAGTKGHALKMLADYLGIPMEQTMAFGDDSNDISLLSMAGLSVAMEKHNPCLEGIADYITGSCNDSGVAQAIRKFCL